MAGSPFPTRQRRRELDDIYTSVVSEAKWI